MAEYVESENLPNYPNGDWISEEEWEETIGRVFEYASQSEKADLDDIDDGYYALQSVNDIGAQRIIPLDYTDQSDEFYTVRGVFDSNPGKTQRYTPWNHTYTLEELNREISEAMSEARLVELEEGHVETVKENFSPEIDLDELSPKDAIVSTIVSAFRDF